MLVHTNFVMHSNVTYKYICRGIDFYIVRMKAWNRRILAGTIFKPVCNPCQRLPSAT